MKCPETIGAIHMTKSEMIEFCDFCRGITMPLNVDAVLLVFNHIDKAANYADREY